MKATASTSSKKGKRKRRSRGASKSNTEEVHEEAITNQTRVVAQEDPQRRETLPTQQLTPTKTRDDDTDDEDQLQMAAAAWAQQADDDSTESNRPGAQGQNHLLPVEMPLSVHITQLSFQATQLDLHRHFAEEGCSVSSVRLVYDRGIDRQRQFRGVAFIDLADPDSFQRALRLDKSVLMGRKINVRPTKSTQELASIVETTRELIASKIRASKDQTKEKVPPHTKRKDTAKAERPKNSRKLTKKERNKRAAILRQKGKGPK